MEIQMTKVKRASNNYDGSEQVATLLNIPFNIRKCYVRVVGDYLNTRKRSDSINRVDTWHCRDESIFTPKRPGRTNSA